MAKSFPIGILGIALVCFPPFNAEGASRSAFDDHPITTGEALNTPLGVPTGELITVEDLTRFASIGDPGNVGFNDLPSQPGIYSPDRSLVAVVVRRGNPERGTNDGTLLIYRAEKLLVDPQPIEIAKISSSTNFQPISMIRWLNDNETVVFAATRDKELSQVFSVNVETGVLKQLTAATDQILWYDINQAGTRLVTITEWGKNPPALDEACRSACRVAASSLWEAEDGISSYSGNVGIYDLSAGTRRNGTDPAVTNEDIVECDRNLDGRMSPDGRFGLRRCIVRNPPSWWIKYAADATEVRDMLKMKTAVQLFLVDFSTGVTTKISEAPVLWDQPEPIWMEDSGSFVLPSAFEPLSVADSSENGKASSSPAVLSVNPYSGNILRIATLPSGTRKVGKVLWSQVDQILSIEVDDVVKKGAVRQDRFRRRGNKWYALPTRSAELRPQVSRIDLVVQESLNDPPVLVARGKHTKRVVLDPNPWLAQKRVARGEKISWSIKGMAAERWSGVLYTPSNSATGVRVPLVIQTHGAHFDRFSLNGGYSRNFAGQALVARGIAVLQVQENVAEVISSLSEFSTARAGYEGAIDHLDALGLIDRNRIGIQGWSRTGPWAGYTITQSKYPIAAGALVNTADFGWWFYMTMGAPAGELDAIYNAPPIGEGLQSWREHAPTFNLDRVHTPMFMWAARKPLSLWDWYAGLRRLDKPVEYWLAPTGVHNAFQIDQRIQLCGLIVDWFVFWLKDEEDIQSSKRDQYLRWRLLRDQQRAGNAAAAEPEKGR